MKIRDLPGWPPSFQAFNLAAYRSGQLPLSPPSGEAVLTGVRKADDHLLIEIEYMGARFRAPLAVDAEPLDAVCEILRASQSRQMREIEELPIQTEDVATTEG